MSEAQQAALQALDQRIEARVQGIREGRDWWPCRRGCDHCCRQLAHPPELSQPEWQRLEHAVAALDPVVRVGIEEKIQTLLNQIAAGTVSAQVVCPYLDETVGACRIYEARPIACRTYGFFVGRDHDQYCQIIETEVAERGETHIVWGSADAIALELKQTSGTPIKFEDHYRPPENF